ncbi:hypothetical protein HK405_011989, partial [Cladochytrium tenue]
MNFLRLARDRLDSDDEIFDIVINTVDSLAPFNIFLSYGIFCNLLELDLASETLKSITLSQSRASPSRAASPSSPPNSSFPPPPPASATPKMSDEHVVFLKFVDGYIDTRLRNTAGAADSTHPPQQQPKVAIALATYPPAPTPDITAAATAAGAASVASALVNDLHASVLLMQYLSCALRPDSPLIAASARAGLPARRLAAIRAGLPAALAAMLALPDRIAAPLARAPGGPATKSDAVAAAVPESVSRALFMLKVDAVKVIANLAYQCREAQDE